MKSFVSIKNDPSEREADKYRGIGFISTALANYWPYKLATPNRLLDFTSAIIERGQYKTFFNPRGIFVGCCVFGFFDEMAEQSFIEHGIEFLEGDDLNSGDQFWILDMVAPRGHALDIVRSVAGSLQNFQTIRYRRVVNGRVRVREIEVSTNAWPFRNRPSQT